MSGHFHARDGERALEMLTQVRDVSCTETATALEAALLEADEIKRLAPPYNRALTVAGRSRLVRDRRPRASLREVPDERHTIGPLASPVPFEALARAARRARRRSPAPLALRARAARARPGLRARPPSASRPGCARFVAEHGRLSSARDVLRRRRAAVGDAGRARRSDGARRGGRDAAPSRRAGSRGTPDKVREALEETVLRAAHAVRRGALAACG